MALRGPIDPVYGSSQDSIYRVRRDGNTQNTQETINRVRYRIRHPEGNYIPIGRGIYGGPALAQQVDRRDVVPVAVGSPNDRGGPGKPQSAVIPTLVGTTDVHQLPGSAPARAPVTRPSPIPQKTPVLPAKQTKGQKMGLDLGNLISTGLDLYRTYEDIRRGPPARVTAGPVAATPVAAQTYWPGQGYGVQQMAGPTFIDAAPGGGIPGYDVISEPPTDDTKGWVYKKVCGEWKWTKPKRRRRRKLLTDSDYNGLLKLQTLKVNSNMNIAIAKSIGR